MTDTMVREVVETAGGGVAIAADGHRPRCANDARRALAAGIYLVLAAPARRGGARSRCFGPFRERAPAQVLATSATYFGLIAPGEAGAACLIAEVGPGRWRARCR